MTNACEKSKYKYFREKNDVVTLWKMLDKLRTLIFAVVCATVLVYQPVNGKWWEEARNEWIVRWLACTQNPCANGAQCVPINSNTDYYCICPTNLPLGGKNCDQLILPTTTTPLPIASPCASAPCTNGGTCVVNSISNTYTCICNQVYYGPRCERTDAWTS